MTGLLPALDRPVFIVAAPRSGSSLLFEMLSRASALWTLGGEARAEFETVPRWNPRQRGYDSNRLTAGDLGLGDRAQLLLAMSRRLRNSEGVRWRALTAEARPGCLRFLEKTPKNALRVPLLRTLFPDARFIFLLRDPRDNVSSILEAWRSGRFVNYRDLPDWPGPPWSLLLPPGWRELRGASLERIAAFQWRAANEIALNDLLALPGSDWCALRYEDLLAAPAAAVAQLCSFMEVPCCLGLQAAVASDLPPSQHTLTPPAPGKWRQNEAQIRSVLPGLEETWARLQALPALGAQ
ncbi:sulfotransferase family protein [Solimonas sp. K1W22B-7]|uniref:sulfotransferase family protein n=1 Tax=Solimonas sp. K1W22B-7 TaxID=2303331 RepID=UPI0013C49D15|nr:sulfotransferase [Solimonas sp. K1W22B-7]